MLSSQSHVRYMVGGVRGLQNGCLDRLNSGCRCHVRVPRRRQRWRWNMSLFHYRNHGSDDGLGVGGNPGAS